MTPDPLHSIAFDPKRRVLVLALRHHNDPTRISATEWTPEQARRVLKQLSASLAETAVDRTTTRMQA